MNHRLLTTGFLLLLLLLPQPGGIASASLYRRIEAQVEKEMGAKKKIPRRILEFTAFVLNDRGTPSLSGTELDLSAEDVEQVLETGLSLVIWGRHPAWTWSECMEAEREIRRVAGREIETLRLGNQLQAAATSAEEFITDFSLLPSKLSAAYAETLGVWGIPGTGAGNDPLGLRIITPEQANAGHILVSINADIGREDERWAASVWRYIYGLDFVTTKSASENPDGESGPGTERKELFRRHPALETHLAELRDHVQSRVIPPLKPGQMAVAILPVREEVKAWVYVRASDQGDSPFPLKDAGLQWKYAIDPVFPSIFSGSTAIPGGVYPPPPVKQDDLVLARGGGGLCATPRGAEGYLCRPRRLQSNDGDCAEAPAEPREDTITLSTCTPPPSDAAQSSKAADICPGMGCTVEVQCGNCNSGPFDAATHPKDAEGKIVICVKDRQDILMSYLIQHEMYHATEQVCPDAKPPTCCQQELPAFSVQCGAMEEDGLLDGTGYDKQGCAELYTSWECKSTCPFSPQYPNPLQLWQKMQIRIQQNYVQKNMNLPLTCRDTLAQPAFAGLNGEQACSPGGRASYPYTVMGHACYLRECAMAAEGHTLLPGREPLVSQESALPWKECPVPPEEDPIKLPVTITLAAFPPYRPAERLQDLLIAYCQQRGRPPMMPTALCQTSPLPSLSLLNTIQGLTGFSNLREQNQRPQEEQRDAMEGMGYAAGMGMYREYLRRASVGLNGTIGAMVTMLERLGESKFPTTLCPLDLKDDTSVCQ